MMEIFWGTITTLYIPTTSIPLSFTIPLHRTVHRTESTPDARPDSTPHGQYTARRVHRPLVSTIFTTKSANRDRQPCFQWMSPGHQKGDTWLGSFHDAERAYLRRTHSGWDEPFFIDTKLHDYIWAYTYRG
jgi:hypothetical protein